MSEQAIEIKDIWLLPNLWTCLQFITVPLMLYFAVQQNLTLFLTCYLLTFVIDSTDGLLARRLGLCTKLGMYLDTYIDLAMYVVVSISLYLFIPDFVSEYLAVLVALFSLTILSRLISVIKFKRALMLHLYTSKMLYFFLTIFVINLYMTDTPSELLFILLLADAALFIGEEFLIIILLKSPREDMLSVFGVFGVLANKNK